jgi:arylsulfatase A-like enzyme/Tfp pilus assembly protein PilF
VADDYTDLVVRRAIIALVLLTSTACARPAPPAQAPAAARNLLIVTIDTLRADRTGAYGYAAARTPAIDALARRGARFERAYAVAPITLPAHASLMTGRYPPGHGARHNGMRVDPAVPTLAGTLATAGFATGAFVSAFPLDRRFGLDKGFQAYGDRLPRPVQGRVVNERPGREAVDEALAWLQASRGRRYFLWVHLFEPHAPYGNPADRRPLEARYDDEVAESDRQVRRLVEAVGSDTLVVLLAAHGESFGEHGEIGHSLFVYDTTLQVPLVIAGPRVAARVVAAPVSQVDLAATALALLGAGALDTDGLDLSPLLTGGDLPSRPLYAESFAPLLDFGWSPLRSLRAGGWKYIAAPRPELYHVVEDPSEQRDVSGAEGARAAALGEQVQRYSPAHLAAGAVSDPDARARLQALGYVGGGPSRTPDRPDPKDRRRLAARIAQVTSGELQGRELEAALREILAEDPDNPQANLRLGYVLQEAGRCGEARPRFERAIAAHLPSADAHLGLAACDAFERRFDRAAAALRAAERVEPGNPVVAANLGIVLSDGGQPAEGLPHLQRALAIDPEFHEARFNLAVAFARLGRRADAAREAEELLRRLPAEAPQRAEVSRLLHAVR